MQILAVDPGAKGGLAYGDSEIPILANMPADLHLATGLRNLHSLIGDIRSGFPNIGAVVEKVGGYVGVDQPASSAFKFGGADMAIKATLVSYGIEYAEVAPVSWQRHLDLPRRPKDAKGKAQHKRDLRDLAQSLYPGLKVTLQTADALLLYHLARRGLIAYGN